MRVRYNKMPTNYDELEYIEASSSSIAYIDPNYTMTSHNLDVEFTVSTTRTGREMCAVGMSSALELGFSSTVGRLIAYTSGITTLAYTNQTNIYNDDKHIFHFWQDNNSRNFQFDALEILTNSSKASLSGNRVYLCTYANGNTSYTLQSSKIYKVIIKDNGTLVRYLIPARNNLNNGVGLYDLIGKHFYESVNDSKFIAGPKKNSSFKFKIPEYLYQRVEFLQSTGTQYINTGYVPKTTNCIIELDMAWTGTAVGDFESFAGFMANGTSPRNGLHKYSGTYMFGANTTNTSSSVPVTNQRVVLKGDFKSGAQKMYLNDVLIANNTTTYNFSTNVLPIYIFNRNYEGPNNYAKMKLYSAKIYEGTTLVRYYIPVKDKVHLQIGLYDIVTNTFVTNSGTGAFLIGDEKSVVLPSGYQQVEYIQSTGTQRIKLEITPTSKYKIEETFAITDTSVTSAIWCSRGSTTDTSTTTAFYIANSSVRCDYGVSASMTNIGNIVADTTHTLVMDSEKWYLDDALKTSMTAATFTSGSKLQLFASHYNGMDSNLGNFAKLKLYSFKVWNEQRELVGDFVPCYKIENSTIGLYDIVGQKFYSNDGSGTFLKGDDIICRITSLLQCKPKTTLLPPEYQQVEYIANSNGAQYLEIPFIPNYTKGFKFEFGMMPTVASQRYCLMANYNVGDRQLSLELNVSNKARLWMNTGNLDKTTTNNYSISTLNTLTYEYKPNTYTVTLNGTTLTGTYTVSGSSSTPTMYMFLDKAKRTSTFSKPIRIYYCIISQEDEEKFHFIPCYRKIDNVIGMYDLIGKTFYFNQGTGSFTKGSNSVTIL